jgi:hypothetical protein
MFAKWKLADLGGKALRDAFRPLASTLVKVDQEHNLGGFIARFRTGAAVGDCEPRNYKAMLTA